MSVEVDLQLGMGSVNRVAFGKANATKESVEGIWIVEGLQTVLPTGLQILNSVRVYDSWLR